MQHQQEKANEWPVQSKHSYLSCPDRHGPLRPKAILSSEYSTGIKRKLGLIQAFQADPLLSILDEHTEGLDPLMQESFYELLADARHLALQFQVVGTCYPKQSERQRTARNIIK